MPPIPSTLDETTRSLVDSLKRRQQDLSGFQIQRLRACTGPLAVQQRFATELREDLDLFAREIESLDVAVDDQRTERDRRELRQIVDEFHISLASLKKDARVALLASKRAIDSQQTSKRDELLQSSAVREKQDLNEKVTEDALMKANNDVTQALHRTITLMQGELERSVFSTQLLDSSTAALRSTSSTHDVLDNLLVTSKHLITALEKSDWMDRLLILAGLIFFLLVVAFILKQRLVDRSLRIAFWWTRFIPDFSSDDALLQAEAGERLVNTMSDVVANVFSTASAVAVSATSSGLSTILTSETPTPSFSNELPSFDMTTTSLLYSSLLTPSSSALLSSETPSKSSQSDGASHDEL